LKALAYELVLRADELAARPHAHAVREHALPAGRVDPGALVDAFGARDMSRGANNSQVRRARGSERVRRRRHIPRRRGEQRRSVRWRLDRQQRLERRRHLELRRR
jgi:hypothetical protein